MWSSQEEISIEIGDYGGIIGGDPDTTVLNFNFELPSGDESLEGQAIVMLLSGFQNPAANNNGDPFEVSYLNPEGGEYRSATLNTEDFESSLIQVFPNPVTDVLNISNLNEVVVGAVYDISGRLIKGDIKLNTNNSTIDLSQVSSGIYFLQLTSQKNNAPTVRRIIKK
jgi:hypothetical protein